MPTPESLVAFVVTAAVLTLTPGVDTALVLRASAIGGPRRGLEAASGIILGCLVWGVLVSTGLGVLLTASPLAFTFLKWAGAIYLASLGLSLVLRPRNRFANDDRLPSAPDPRQTMKQGFATNLLNPKVGLFYLTFLPQFTSDGTNAGVGIMILAVVHALLSLTWLAIIAVATVPFRKLLERRAVVMRLDQISGLTFIALAAWLARSPHTA